MYQNVANIAARKGFLPIVEDGILYTLRQALFNRTLKTKEVIEGFWVLAEVIAAWRWM